MKVSFSSHHPGAIHPIIQIFLLQKKLFWPPKSSDDLCLFFYFFYGPVNLLPSTAQQLLYDHFRAFYPYIIIDFFCSCHHAVDHTAGCAALSRLQRRRLSRRGVHGRRSATLPQGLRQMRQVPQGARARHHQRAPDAVVLQGLLRRYLHAAGVQHRHLRRHCDAGRYSAAGRGGKATCREGGARQAGATLPRLRHEGGSVNRRVEFYCNHSRSVNLSVGFYCHLEIGQPEEGRVFTAITWGRSTGGSGFTAITRSVNLRRRVLPQSQDQST